MQELGARSSAVNEVGKYLEAAGCPESLAMWAAKQLSLIFFISNVNGLTFAFYLGPSPLTPNLCLGLRTEKSKKVFTLTRSSDQNQRPQDIDKPLFALSPKGSFPPLLVC